MPQEQSATPSTLERLLADLRCPDNHGTGRGCCQCTVNDTLDEISKVFAALRPSERPETGRPPAANPTEEQEDEIIDRLKLRRLSKETLVLMVADLAWSIQQRVDLAALTAGPETGDRA